MFICRATHYILKCFVLIDLKVDDLTHQDIGQMQMYVNYYTREMLNSIPIFSRRTGFQHGLGIALLFAALGKMAGSIFGLYSDSGTDIHQ